jgi:hypothetical protein
MKKKYIIIALIFIIGIYGYIVHKINNKKIDPVNVEFNFNNNLKYKNLRNKIAQAVYKRDYDPEEVTDVNLYNIIKQIVEDIPNSQLKMVTQNGNIQNFKFVDASNRKLLNNEIEISFETDNSISMINTIKFL